MAQYRVLQISPAVWELDCAFEGGWRFVDRFGDKAAAQKKLAELVSDDAWKAPEPEYFSADGQKIVTEADDATT